MAERPIILLGAARSGTKLLRTLVAAGDGIRCVPYDVNYIWRFRNGDCPHDVLPPDSATPQVCQFIQKQLRACSGARRNERFTEKTVGNILRIPFVEKVFPDAQYIVLIRDGRDVIESAMRCWREPPQMGYLLAKVKTFPWLSCGSYAFGYGRSVLGRMLGVTSQLSTWGPRYEGIDRDVAKKSLLEVCASQWVACIESAEHAVRSLPQERLLVVRYEDLVRNPSAETLRIANYLGCANPIHMSQFADKHVSSANWGKHRRMSELDQERIQSIAGPALARWGYADLEEFHKAA